MGTVDSEHHQRVTDWDPAAFCSPNEEWRRDSRPAFALIILNQKLDCFADSFVSFWDNAQIRVCADGGANRLHDALSEQERGQFLPSAIIGDLDSLRDDVRRFYESNDVEISKIEDQDSTDFGKCLKYVSKHDMLPSSITRGDGPENTGTSGANVPHPKMTVVALGGFGGRVDQSFHSINMLYTALEQEGNPRKIFLISPESITFLCRPGMNTVQTPQKIVGPTCGIIPVGKPSIISLVGFEWNLDKEVTRFGGMVSTSNHLKADTVNIETTEPVVFTVEFKSATEDTNTGRLRLYEKSKG